MRLRETRRELEAVIRQWEEDYKRKVSECDTERQRMRKLILAEVTSQLAHVFATAESLCHAGLVYLRWVRIFTTYSITAMGAISFDGWNLVCLCILCVRAARHVEQIRLDFSPRQNR